MKCRSVAAVGVVIVGFFAACSPFQGGEADFGDCPNCFFTLRDNPVYRDFYRLDERSDGHGNSSFEEVLRVSPTQTLYKQFDIVVQTSGGDPSKGAVAGPNLVAVPIPNVGPDDWLPGDNYRWEAHGLQVGYVLMEAKALAFDAFFNPHIIGALVAPQIRLDPRVMLVPIHLVRVVPRSSSSPFAYLTNIKTETYKQLWDDIPRETIQGEGVPGFPNNQVIVSQVVPDNQTDFGIFFTQPDSIWTQCNIQFRMVGCSVDSANSGQCPDLVVDDDSRVNVTDCQQQGPHDHTTVRNNWADAQLLSGVGSYTTMPIVITMNHVDGNCPGGVSVDVATTGLAALSASGSLQHQYPLVAAHEMGHVLGLEDDLTCDIKNPATLHLMCGNVDLQRPNIRPADCASARSHFGHDYAHQRWGVDVTP